MATLSKEDSVGLAYHRHTKMVSLKLERAWALASPRLNSQKEKLLAFCVGRGKSTLRINLWQKLGVIDYHFNLCNTCAVDVTYFTVRKLGLRKVK